MRSFQMGRVMDDLPTPVDAIVRLVRTYARKVRSDARWSRATLPAFSRVSAGFHAAQSTFRLLDICPASIALFGGGSSATRKVSTALCASNGRASGVVSASVGCSGELVSLCMSSLSSHGRGVGERRSGLGGGGCSPAMGIARLLYMRADVFCRLSELAWRVVTTSGFRGSDQIPNCKLRRPTTEGGEDVNVERACLLLGAGLGDRRTCREGGKVHEVRQRGYVLGPFMGD